MSGHEPTVPESVLPPPADQRTDSTRPANPPDRLDVAAKLIQIVSVVAGVVSVVVGVVMSVLSFNAARTAEAHAREVEVEARREDARRYQQRQTVEAERRQTEAVKPFLDLRQRLYLEAVQAAAILANPDDHTQEETKKARKRFRELYVAELSLVEGSGVERGMKELARVVEPGLLEFTPRAKPRLRFGTRAPRFAPEVLALQRRVRRQPERMT